MSCEDVIRHASEISKNARAIRFARAILDPSIYVYILVLPSSLSIYMTTTEEAEGHANASGEPMRFGEDVLRLAMRPFGLDELLRSHQEVACYPPL